MAGYRLLHTKKAKFFKMIANSDHCRRANVLRQAQSVDTRPEPVADYEPTLGSEVFNLFLLIPSGDFC